MFILWDNSQRGGEEGQLGENSKERQYFPATSLNLGEKIIHWFYCLRKTLINGMGLCGSKQNCPQLFNKMTRAMLFGSKGGCQSAQGLEASQR